MGVKLDLGPVSAGKNAVGGRCSVQFRANSDILCEPSLSERGRATVRGLPCSAWIKKERAGCFLSCLIIAFSSSELSFAFLLLVCSSG